MPHNPTGDTPIADEAALLAAIVRDSNDAIIVATFAGIVRAWNAAAERLLGFRAEEAIGKPITFIIPPDRLPEEYEVLARLRRGAAIAHYRTIRRTKEGGPVDVLVTVSPVRNHKGETVAASQILLHIPSAKGV